jgi:hypothetical protein
MPSARLVAAGALAAVLAVPATAQAAPTIAPLEGCYVSAAATQRESIALEVGGFTPNSLVDVTIDGRAVPGATGVQTDPTGAFQGTVPAPYRPSGERRFTLTVTQVGDPGNTVSAGSRVTALTVAVTPKQAQPTRRVRFAGRGFTKPGPVYAHYVYRGRLRETVRMGTPTGVCGRFSARRRQIPVRPRTGTWLVQFDQLPEWTNPPEDIFVQLQIRVFRTFQD